MRGGQRIEEGLEPARAIRCAYALAPLHPVHANASPAAHERVCDHHLVERPSHLLPFPFPFLFPFPVILLRAAQEELPKPLAPVLKRTPPGAGAVLLAIEPPSTAFGLA